MLRGREAETSPFVCVYRTQVAGIAHKPLRRQLARAVHTTRGKTLRIFCFCFTKHKFKPAEFKATFY